MSLSRFVFAIVFLQVSVVAVFADWSTYLNGNDRAGYSPTELKFPLKLVWHHTAPAKPRMAWEGPGPGGEREEAKARGVQYMTMP